MARVQSYAEVFSGVSRETKPVVLPADRTGVADARVHLAETVQSSISQLGNAWLRRQDERDRLAAQAAYNRFAIDDINERANLEETVKGGHAIGLDDPMGESVTQKYAASYDILTGMHMQKLENDNQRGYFDALVQDRKVSALGAMRNYEQSELEAYRTTSKEGMVATKKQEGIDNPATLDNNVAFVKEQSAEYYALQGVSKDTAKAGIMADSTDLYLGVIDDQLSKGNYANAQVIFDKGVKNKDILPEVQDDIRTQIDRVFVQVKADEIAQEFLKAYETTGEAMTALRNDKRADFKTHPELKTTAYSRLEAYGTDRDAAYKAELEGIYNSALTDIQQAGSLVGALDIVDEWMARRPKDGDMTLSLRKVAVDLYGGDGSVKQSDPLAYIDLTQKINSGEIVTPYDLYNAPEAKALSLSDIKDRLGYLDEGGIVGNLKIYDMVDAAFKQYNDSDGYTADPDLYAAVQIETYRYAKAQAASGTLRRDDINNYMQQLFLTRDTWKPFDRASTVEAIAQGESIEEIIDIQAKGDSAYKKLYKDRIEALINDWNVENPDSSLTKENGYQLFMLYKTGSLKDFTTTDLKNLFNSLSTEE